MRRPHQRVGAELHAIEAHLVPTAGHVQRLERRDGHTLGPALDQEKRYPVLSFAARARCHNCEVGAFSIGYEELDAVQLPAGADRLGGESDARRIPATCGLGERERGSGLAFGDRAQHLFLLGFASGLDESRDGHTHGGEERARQQRAPALFQHDDQIEKAARSAVALWDAERGPAQAGHLLPERRIVGIGAFHQLADELGWTFLGEKVPGRAPEHLLLFGKCEIHQRTMAMKVAASWMVPRLAFRGRSPRRPWSLLPPAARLVGCGPV